MPVVHLDVQDAKLAMILDVLQDVHQQHGAIGDNSLQW